MMVRVDTVSRVIGHVRELSATNRRHWRTHSLGDRKTSLLLQGVRHISEALGK